MIDKNAILKLKKLQKKFIDTGDQKYRKQAEKYYKALITPELETLIKDLVKLEILQICKATDKTIRCYIGYEVFADSNGIISVQYDEACYLEKWNINKYVKK